MAESKKLREPKLGAALNQPAPSQVRVWDPWKEEVHAAEKPAPAKKLKEPALSGVVGPEISASKVKTWNPWPHAEAFGVTPPDGYSGAHAPATVAKAAPASVSQPDVKRIQIGNAPPLAKRMSRLGTESAFDVLGRVRKLEAEGKSIISFALGEPDFDSP